MWFLSIALEGYPLYNYDQTSPLAGTAAPGYAATSYPNYPNTGGGAYDSSAYGAHPGHTGSEQLYDDNTQQGRTVEDNQWNVSSFSDKRIRQAFIKKVKHRPLHMLAYISIKLANQEKR